MVSGGVTARGWLEHRSRVQNFPSTVRMAWMIAGILPRRTALRQGERSAGPLRLGAGCPRPASGRQRIVATGGRSQPGNSSAISFICSTPSPGTLGPAAFHAGGSTLGRAVHDQAPRHLRLPRGASSQHGTAICP